MNSAPDGVGGGAGHGPVGTVCIAGIGGGRQADLQAQHGRAIAAGRRHGGPHLRGDDAEVTPVSTQSPDREAGCRVEALVDAQERRRRGRRVCVGASRGRRRQRESARVLQDHDAAVAAGADGVDGEDPSGADGRTGSWPGAGRGYAQPSPGWKRPVNAGVGVRERRVRRRRSEDWHRARQRQRERGQQSSGRRAQPTARGPATHRVTAPTHQAIQGPST